MAERATGRWLSDPSDYAELALSQWGLWDDQLDEQMFGFLLCSWARRKRWEAELIAAAVAKALSGPRQAATRGAAEPERVSADSLMRLMGARWR